jgi:hypothetical protein
MRTGRFAGTAMRVADGRAPIAYPREMPKPHSPIDVEKLLRMPQKEDAVLPSPKPLFAYGLDPANGCIEGYRRAARIVVDRVKEYSSEQSFLFYPVVFLYRHCIELMLKRLLFAFDQSAVRRVTQAAPLSQNEIDSSMNGKTGHSLQWLWDKVRPAAEALGRNVIDPQRAAGISFYIQQLNEIDPGAVNFRYTSNIDATRTKLANAHKAGSEVDLIEFSEAMERLAAYLDGLDTHVAAIIDRELEMEADAYESGDFY